MNYDDYELESEIIRGTFPCPNCKKKKNYSAYISNSTGKYLHPCVGNCTACKYHYKPKEYLKHIS